MPLSFVVRRSSSRKIEDCCLCRRRLLLTPPASREKERVHLIESTQHVFVEHRKTRKQQQPNADASHE
jgi:hypothetical protein